MSSIIADLKKNSREIIRIDVSEFKGKELINIRVWFEDISGGYKPTQKGVALDISQYEEFKNSILKIGEFIEDRKNGKLPTE